MDGPFVKLYDSVLKDGNLDSTEKLILSLYISDYERRGKGIRGGLSIRDVSRALNYDYAHLWLKVKKLLNRKCLVRDGVDGNRKAIKFNPEYFSSTEGDYCQSAIKNIASRQYGLLPVGNKDYCQSAIKNIANRQYKSVPPYIPLYLRERVDKKEKKESGCGSGAPEGAPVPPRRTKTDTETDTATETDPRGEFGPSKRGRFEALLMRYPSHYPPTKAEAEECRELFYSEVHTGKECDRCRKWFMVSEKNPETLREYLKEAPWEEDTGRGQS